MKFDTILKRYNKIEAGLVYQARIQAYQRACRIHPQTAKKLLCKQTRFIHQALESDVLLGKKVAFEVVQQRYPRIFGFFRQCCELMWALYPEDSLLAVIDELQHGIAPMFLPNFLIWHALGKPYGIKKHMAAWDIREALIALGLSGDIAGVPGDIPHPTDWHSTFVQNFDMHEAYTNDPWRITYCKWLTAHLEARKETTNVS